MARHVLARSLHDVGLAAWFGGSLMGAVGLNGATASLRNPEERTSASTLGWSRWAPVAALSIGSHLIGAVQLLNTESARVRRQEGVGRSSAIKTALTVAAIGTTAYSGVLNRKMASAGNSTPSAGATEPGAQTPPDIASAQRQLKTIQWAIPALTGALVSVTAWQSEQMRPRQQLAGSISGVLRPLFGTIPLAATGAGTVLFLASRRRSSRKSKSISSSSSSTPTPVVSTTPTSSTTSTTTPYPSSTDDAMDSSMSTSTMGTSSMGTSTMGTSGMGTGTGLGTGTSSSSTPGSI